MKAYKIITPLCAALLLGLASCKEDTKGLTGVVYYPVITLEGETYSIVPSGTPYAEPGYSATLDGKDITSEVTITSGMDFADPQPGYYSITYSAVNPEGFAASETRYVIVSDPSDAASGFYASDPDSFRDYNGTTFYGGEFQVIVAGNGDGTYYVSDMLGGWYAQRAGYGSAYAMEGEIAIAPDGTVTLLDSFVQGWGDSLTGISGGVYDPTAGSLHWVAEYTDNPMLFDLTLYKQ